MGVDGRSSTVSSLGRVLAALTGVALAAAAPQSVQALPSPVAAGTGGKVIDHPVTTTGCGRPSPYPRGTTTKGRLVSDGVQRRYLVHVPDVYSPARPTPLVLSFHGRTRNARYQEQLTGMSALDAIVVYPQSLVGAEGKPAWQGAPYSPRADDVLFTSDLISRLQKKLCVDARRIYAAGKSNGGGLVALLACEMPGRIAAFAPVAGAFYPQGDRCAPSRPATVLDIHGTADPVVPYGGSAAKRLPPIRDWLTDWATRDGCEETDSHNLGHGVTLQHWLECDQDAAVAHLRVKGLGHNWPSTTPNKDSDEPSVIDATPFIWSFFQNHPLPR